MQGYKWSLPQNPFHCIYTPELFNNNENAFHQVLGYPVCPLVGRYNKGQYKIGEVILYLQFKCKFIDGVYMCGQKPINIPQTLVQRLRTIPEVIPHNKPKNQQKNEKIPNVHPLHFPIRDQLSIGWIISLGKIGKDFLNYLNHTYIFDSGVFFGEKLKLTTHNLPIMSFCPEGSGLQPQEVERGICTTHFRSQYLSVHLKGGAPAFSPNNMRLGILGVKKREQERIAEKEKKKQKEKGKNKGKKYVEKVEEEHKTKEGLTIENQKPEKVAQVKKQERVKKEDDDFDLDWEQMEKQIKQENKKDIKVVKQVQEQEKKPKPSQVKQKKEDNQQFVHFYTSALLEQDYRVFYHWYVDENYRKEIIVQLLKTCSSVQEFVSQYITLVGLDPLGKEINRLLNIM